jgi:hypothetical protein
LVMICHGQTLIIGGCLIIGGYWGDNQIKNEGKRCILRIFVDGVGDEISKMNALYGC